ncbi:MFS transporter [Singulisphaera acidiphila]|uniref:Arabinose efflux permease family protein n=1 Tax=Singulisphaera acidiphila (strain ATCC BAA-1392 / DSM 18658 / VKM B-2454 / MOB10) TaxID=886293 RepID=L0DCS5_SINAD|nr:MFS transporter [Singulisphaera acidiphila]AGA26441.1 arabinose efflux permease family protein [Singulisphaera acidiphila DSM 18658]
MDAETVPTDFHRIRRAAWLAVALLAPVALLNYLDRQMLAAMKTSMMTDIPDIGSRENWGFMLGSFKWVYALLSPIGGYIADRFSRRLVIIASLFVWSAVTWSTGYVTTYDGLVATRALMGISEAFYIPAALALITDFHRGSTRSRAVGIHQMGMYAGIVLGGFAGHVADQPNLGWRFAFQACGVVGILYSVPLFWLLRDPSESQTSNKSHPTSLFRAWLELVKNRDFLLLVLYFTLPALAGWVVKDWMPDILRERFSLQQGNAGVYAVIPVQLASLIGVGIGGWMADAWMKRSERGRIFVSALGMILFLPALFGVGFSEHLGLAVGFLILYGIGWGFFDCNNMPILSQLVRPELRATGYGFMNLVSISCGGFADWGFGRLRDQHVSIAAIFGIFAGIALISVAIVLMIHPRPELAPKDS